MKALLIALGGMAAGVGYYGLIVSFIVWLLGLIGVISYVSFWWVAGFFLSWITGVIICTETMATVGKKRWE